MTYTEKNLTAESNKFHVSNVQMYEYLDQARHDWYRYCILIGVEAVIVHISADFKKEIFNRDQLQIRTRLERIGNTSFTLKQVVINNRDELVASAEVVMATIDRQARTKVTVPEELHLMLHQDAPLNLLINNRDS
jgi:thioesterase III